MDQGENGLEPHQSNSGESERQTIKTGEQLMLMALEPRQYQGNSQWQSRKIAAENIIDKPKADGNQQEKAGTEDLEGNNGKLAPNLESNQAEIQTKAT